MSLREGIERALASREFDQTEAERADVRGADYSIVTRRLGRKRTWQCSIEYDLEMPVGRSLLFYLRHAAIIGAVTSGPARCERLGSERREQLDLVVAAADLQARFFLVGLGRHAQAVLADRCRAGSIPSPLGRWSVALQLATQPATRVLFCLEADGPRATTWVWGRDTQPVREALGLEDGAPVRSEAVLVASERIVLPDDAGGWSEELLQGFFASGVRLIGDRMTALVGGRRAGDRR